MALRTDEFIKRANDMIDTAISFAGFIILKRDHIEDLIDRIDGAIPEDIKEATRILRRKDDIIADAKYNAERIINDAMNEKNKILSESELLSAVQEEAAIIREKLISECEEIKNKAYADAENIRYQVSEEARRIREGAENYAEQILSNINANIEQHQAIVKNGLEYIEQRKMNVQRSSEYTSAHGTEYQKEYATSTEEYSKY